MIDTPAHRILSGFFGGPGGGFGQLPFSVDVPDDAVRFVRVIPHSDGAWVAWQYQGLNAETPPPVMLQRLDAGGSPVSPQVAILDGWAADAIPAFASLGDRLAFAYLDNADPFGITIMLRVLGSDGALQFERAFQPSGPYAEAHLDLFASPAHDQLLLGWSRGTMGDTPPTAFVARFCVPTLGR